MSVSIVAVCIAVAALAVALLDRVKNYEWHKEAIYRLQDFDERMNLNSEVIIDGAKAEPYLSTAEDGTQFQLLRTAYYKKCTDHGKLCLSFIVSMKDSYKK